MKSGRKGFTLIEIMIAVVIIGMLVAVAVPALQKARKNSAHARFMNDLRIFAGAVETLYLASGIKPVDSSTGQMDPALQDYVSKNFFQRATPIGGDWDVESDDSGISLGVGVDGYTIDKDELIELDAKYDDGDLSSGKLVEIVSNRRYYWVLEH